MAFCYANEVIVLLYADRSGGKAIVGDRKKIGQSSDVYRRDVVVLVIQEIMSSEFAYVTNEVKSRLWDRMSVPAQCKTWSYACTVKSELVIKRLLKCGGS